MRLGCVIMASGEGKRFSAAGGGASQGAAAEGIGPGNKLLAPLAGMPLIARTVTSVPQETFDVAVSTRWPQVASVAAECGARVVRPDGVLRSDSVRAGLSVPEAHAWNGCLFLPGDQPLVTWESFRALATAFSHDSRCAYRLAWNGTPGSPVLFPSSCFDALRRLEGKNGGSGVLRSGTVPVELIEATRQEELWDVDVPADLVRIERFLVAQEVLRG